MIKYILPAIIAHLIVVFWKKITEIVFKNCNSIIKMSNQKYLFKLESNYDLR